MLRLFALAGVFFLEALGKQNGLARTPPMAWNSWNHFACNISESLIKETTDALVSLGLADLGYDYVNLDDCWQASKRDANGRIQPDATRFPSGLKAIGDYIHSKGLKFGIYSSAGFKTCQAFPASLGLETFDAQSYASWGVDYLKYDNCYTDAGTPYQRYPPMGKALEASGREILYSLCEWGVENPAVWAGEIANSWRVSMDIKDGWESILSRIDIDAPLWRYAGPGGWNDPDMLEVGNGKCSDSEYRYHFSLWAMLKAPLIIGNDIRGMKTSDAAFGILSNKEVIAVSQDPWGHQARRIWSDSKITQAGGRLIATKCSSSNDMYADAPVNQQWVLQDDGKIVSSSTKQCLYEHVGEHDSDVDPLDMKYARFGVGTIDCSDPLVTLWSTSQQQPFSGGRIHSLATGRCLEVSKLELVPLVQGKRIQTGECHQIQQKKYLDVHEHQSWSNPSGTLLNLYQRQCLTVDQDAGVGKFAEIWSVPLSDGSLAVVLANKGPVPQVITLTWEMLGWKEGQRVQVRDLWKHSDAVLPATGQVSELVPSHDVVMLKLTKLH